MYEDSFDLGVGAGVPDGLSMASSGALEPLLAILGYMWLIALVFYVYSALCWFYVAKRTNTPNGWFAFVPILGTILMLQIAKRPLWWIILFLVPIVNVVIAIMVFLDILKALKRPWWWLILQFIPVVNLVIMGLMAWGKTDQTISKTTIIPPTPLK